MSDYPPATVGAHVGSNTERQELVREFDDVVLAGAKPGTAKRSDAILESMEWRTMIERQFASHDLGDLGARAKRETIRQALADHLREHAGD